MDFLEIVTRILIDRGLASPADIRGCSEAEVVELEKHVGFKLPQVYRLFLLSMGHNAGQFLNNTDYHYQSLFGLRRRAEELLTANGVDFTLPPDAFVFAMYKNVDFFFFIASDREDPSLWEYLHGEPEPLETSQRFSLFIVKSVTMCMPPR